MGSSESPRGEERSERPAEEPLPPASGEDLDPFPASNAMTPEGYIEGIGDFAQGLKRMLRRWRRRE
jgi:hypothetical protein